MANFHEKKLTVYERRLLDSGLSSDDPIFKICISLRKDHYLARRNCADVMIRGVLMEKNFVRKRIDTVDEVFGLPECLLHLVCSYIGRSSIKPRPH